jgi:hypothetical protein
MEIKALRTINSNHYGQISKNQVVEMEEFIAEQYIQQGIAVAYSTKVICEKPRMGDVPLVSGRGKESSLSRPAQVLPKKTATNSRKKKS